MWPMIYLAGLVVLFGIYMIREKRIDSKLEKMNYNDPGYWDLKKKKDDLGLVPGLWVVFGAPVAMLIDVAAQGAGAGAFIILLVFFVVCGLGGWVSSGATNSAPPPPPKPPQCVDKHWQQSPGGIETQKFEGDYDGSLNKEFEDK